MQRVGFALLAMLVPTAVFAPAASARVNPGGSITDFPASTFGDEYFVQGPDGAVWFTNTEGNTIGRITAAGAISTFSGPGIDAPGDITVGPDGALWFVNAPNNYGGTIGRITTSGQVQVFSAPSIDEPVGITAGPNGALWFTNEASGSIGEITTSGTVSDFTDPEIEQPTGITAGPDGALWFADDDAIGRITVAGSISLYASAFGLPQGSIVAGPDGALWFTTVDDGSPGLGRLTTDGVSSVVTQGVGAVGTTAGDLVAGPNDALWYVGPSTIGFVPVDGQQPGTFDDAQLSPSGITVGSDGNLWFGNDYQSEIGRLTPTGTFSYFAGNQISGPSSITTGPDHALWFTNDGDGQSGFSIGRMTPDGSTTTFSDPSISNPGSITTGPDGALWFTNQPNSGDPSPGSIGRITTGGVVSNFTSPDIDYPAQLVVGPDGALWFTNYVPGGASSIERITTTGDITGFTDPRLNEPTGGITVGPDGALWFTNGGGSSIGRITTAGAFSFFPLNPSLQPLGIVTGPDGALWFTALETKPVGHGQNFHYEFRGVIGRMTTTGHYTTRVVFRQVSPQAIVVGPDGALWFTAQNGGPNNPPSFVGRLTTQGRLTTYRGPLAAFLPSVDDLTVGPDGALWYADTTYSDIGRVTTPSSVWTTPASGRPGTSLAVSGAGFGPNETVTVKYDTGRSGSNPAIICSTDTDAGGEFHCSGDIPTRAGPLGSHTITARGSVTGTSARTTFTLVDG